MCGIAGVIDYSGHPIDPSLLVAMRDRMVHRGPDDYGAVLLSSEQHRANGGASVRPVPFRNLDELNGGSVRSSSTYSIGFAHRRLSIVDLSAAGHQPMCNEDGTIWVTFNGEIYNFQQIRLELESAGHVFHSLTDTEVILHSYEEWGMRCLERFIGMFAFALWDSHTQRLVLVRDRIGIKPLYYAFVGSQLLFASEIKAILEHPSIRREVDEQSLYHYLTFFCVPAPRTLFKGIFKLEAGHYLSVMDVNECEEVAYWNMFRRRNEESFRLAENDVREEVLEVFHDATRLQMISDVPFGAFLSGGIDSSFSVAVMSRILDQPVNTFSIGFEDAPELNELHWARQIVERFGTRHHEIVIAPDDVTRFLHDMIYYQDEPIADSVCVPIYFLSKLARESGVTVCQVGEGSDELFCGYPSWIEAIKGYESRDTFLGQLCRVPQLLATYLSSHILDLGWVRYDNLLSFFNQGEVFWGGAVSYRDRLKRVILSRDFLNRVPQATEELILLSRQHFTERCYAPDHLSWLTYTDLRLRLPELLLMRLDKMNMAVSLEGRVPYLDHRLVELVMSLPQALKIGRNECKHLLKRAIDHTLPDAILNRPKRGLQLPERQWYQQAFRHSFETLLRDFTQNTEYFNTTNLHRLTSRKGVPWIIINFILWHRMWIEKSI